MKRRQALQILSAGLASSVLPVFPRPARAFFDSPAIHNLLNAEQETDHVLVLIWLEGGNDGLNTIVPYADPEYVKNRQNTGFSTSSAQKLFKTYIRPELALNPSLEALVPHWNEGRLAIVENVGYPQPDLSHFRAADIWNSASDIDILESTGWIARWFMHDYPNYPDILPSDPLAISMGELSPFLFRGTRGQMDVLVNDPQHFHPTNAFISPNLPSTYGGRELQWLGDLISVSDTFAKRFEDLLPKYGRNAVEYPSSGIARDLANIAQCIGAGLRTRVYFCFQNGYDTHYYQNSTDSTVDGHGKLLLDLAQALDAFQRDLEAQGLDDRVITMTYSEFGRRVSENGAFTSGTDHGTSAPQILLGSKVNGELYGSTPNLSDLDSDGNLKSEFEFRKVYASILGDWFGVPSDIRQTLLSPQREHALFDLEFPVNGSGVLERLIRTSSKVQQHDSRESSIRASVFPDPCVDRFAIEIELREPGLTRIELFDIRGKLIQILVEATLLGGSHIFELRRPSGIAAGTYPFRLTSGQSTYWGKLNVM